MRAERKWLDAALSFPFRQAAPKITLDAGRGLVAVLGSLGEKLHDDGRDSVREVRPTARRAAPAAAQCGSGPIPSDRRRIKGSAPVSIS